MSETIELIPLDQIRPHPANRVHGRFDETKLQQLAESIKAIGVQQPAVVRGSPVDGYELVAGERRWRASKIAGLDHLPCVVRVLDDKQALTIQIVENLQREEVHPLDEADGYERLMREGGYEPGLIAQEVGRSISYVYQRIRLNALVPDARQLLLDGEIQVAHAVLLARLGEDQQHETLKAMRHRMELGIRAADLDEWIRDNILMELGHVAWKLDEAELIKKAGSCAACSKRTGAEPALFDDIKADHCTDTDCFKAKQAAIISRNKGELGKDGLLVIRGYYYAGKEKVLGAGSWEECKKKDEGAVRCLILDGSSPGRLVWGRKIAKVKPQRAIQDEEDDDIDPAELARREAADKREEAHKLTNRRLYEQILEKARATKNASGILRLLVFERLREGYDMEQVVERHGWQSEDDLQGIVDSGLRELDVPSILALLVEETISDAYDVNRWKPPVLESLEPWLNFFSIDEAAVRAAVHEELGVSLEEEPEEDEE